MVNREPYMQEFLNKMPDCLRVHAKTVGSSTDDFEMVHVNQTRDVGDARGVIENIEVRRDTYVYGRPR